MSFDSDRIAAQLRVLLSVLVPAAVLMTLLPSTQVAGGVALVALAAAVTLIQVTRVVLPMVAAPPRARGPQTATHPPVCRSITLPQDPIRPRAPGLV